MSSQVKKTQKSVFTLRFSLLSIFISLFSIAMIASISVFYFHINELVLKVALMLMNNTSKLVLNELDIQLRPEKISSQLSASLIQNNIIPADNLNQVSNYLMNRLIYLPLAQGVYWGDQAGNFVYASKGENGNIILEIINRNSSPPTNTYIYHDKNFKEIKKIILPVNYDPRTRPWYQKAAKERSLIWTNVYLYSKPNYLGVTVAAPVFFSDNKLRGVFGVDIRLDYLSRYVAKQKIARQGEVVIINKDGMLIAARQLLKLESLPLDKPIDIHHLLKPWFEKAFQIYQKTKQPVLRYKVNGVAYLATFDRIPLLENEGWMISIVDTESDFTKGIHTIEMLYLVVALSLLILGIIAITILVNRIVKPIKRLVHETQLIKHFNLEDTPPLDSRIKEVVELSAAVRGMKQGLRSFQKYVPASLVRQLIKTGEDARIGGVKKNLAVFFTDINDFTTLTEEADPNQLVMQICEYIEIFSDAIVAEEGTIDKYIGDSIMAFWGAPLHTDKPCHHAARAILRGMHAIDHLNKRWIAEGKPAFINHVGLNYGEAIVGNIGSFERLNYTALGDMVNTASRFVGVNKIYGTSIIVSESVYHVIQDSFVLRLVDCVILKGKTKSSLIYELLAEHKESIEFDIDRYQAKFSVAFSAYQKGAWEEALSAFNQCLVIYSQDNLAPVFITRCLHFKQKPPPSWDGVWHLSKK